MSTSFAAAQRLAAVTVLGLGPMGRALGHAFLVAGHPITVWNRTPGKDDELVAAGAHVAPSVSHALRASELVVICLVDDDAVRAVLQPAAGDLAGRTLVNLTSGTPDQARARAAWAADRSAAYLSGAILTPTPAIGTPAAVVLYAGPREVYGAVHPALAALGGTSTHLDEDPGRASAYDTALLDLFHTAVHGIGHAFALATAEGIAPTRLAPYAAAIGGMLPEMIGRFAAQLEAGDFPGDRSTVASSRSSVAHVVATATARGLDTSVLDGASAALDRVIAAGHPDDGLARIATAVQR